MAAKSLKCISASKILCMNDGDILYRISEVLKLIFAKTENVPVSDRFVATASQTAFTLTKTPSVKDHVLIFVDGVLQDSSAYTLNGTALVFGTGLAVGKVVNVKYYSNSLSL